MSEIIRVPFHGEDVLAVDVNGRPHIVLKPALESIGLDYWAQVRKLRRRSWACAKVRVSGADGKQYMMVAVPMDVFERLLVTVDPSRVLLSKTRSEVAAHCGLSDDTQLGLGYIYVIRFSSGVVKFGKTRNPQRRLSTYVREAALYGGSVTDQWVSERHEDYSSVETALIEHFAERAVSGQEFVVGVEFSTVVDYVRHLVATEVTL